MQARQASDVKGIDVSHWQGSIDWKKVAADGVKYVFIKATDGASKIDLKLSSNATGAAAAGLKVGFYHYAHPDLNAPETEAANFFRNVKQYKADFPHALDVEGEASKVGAAALTTWCIKFLREVERLTGHPAMIYTGASFAKTYLGTDKARELGKWPLWIAHYKTDKPMANPTWDRWATFQYSDAGKVTGISGNVDMNAMDQSFYDKYVLAPQPQPAKEEVDELELTKYQRDTLVAGLEKLHKDGKLNDANWIAKAKDGTLTVSELSWLGFILATR